MKLVKLVVRHFHIIILWPKKISVKLTYLAAWACETIVTQIANGLDSSAIELFKWYLIVTHSILLFIHNYHFHHQLVTKFLFIYTSGPSICNYLQKCCLHSTLCKKTSENTYILYTLCMLYYLKYEVWLLVHYRIIIYKYNSVRLATNWDCLCTQSTSFDSLRKEMV